MAEVNYKNGYRIKEVEKDVELLPLLDEMLEEYSKSEVYKDSIFSKKIILEQLYIAHKRGMIYLGLTEEDKIAGWLILTPSIKWVDGSIEYHSLSFLVKEEHRKGSNLSDGLINLSKTFVKDKNASLILSFEYSDKNSTDTTKRYFDRKGFEEVQTIYKYE